VIALSAVELCRAPASIVQAND